MPDKDHATSDRRPADESGSSMRLRDGAGGSVLGDFELRRVLGRGGMGTVYEAWQRSLKRRVAIKVLANSIGSSRKAIERFQLEAQAAAKLNHMHIIPIYARGEEKGTYYYAMELIEGQSLHAIINARREDLALDPRSTDLAETVPLIREQKGGASDVTRAQRSSASSSFGSTAGGASSSKTGAGASTAQHYESVARHVASIADALHYAHTEGVIHRDIKPHNLMLGDDGRMRVADFGLARMTEQPGMTMTGEMVGSPLYMAPEQISGAPGAVDHRADIYALGATMYEWLTLSPPHTGETREAVISKILRGDPTPLRVHDPDIPMDLETICLKALEHDPTKRYRSASDLRDDLRRYLAKETIRARRAGLFEQAGKLVSRNRFASLAAVAAIMLLVLAGALVSTKRQVKTKTQQIAKAQEQTDQLLDVIRQLSPLGGATVPVLEGLVETGRGLPFVASGAARADGGLVAAGAHPEEASSPHRIARRATADLYEALAESVAPSDTDAVDRGDVSTALLQLAYDMRDGDAEGGLRIVDTVLESQSDNAQALQLRMVLNTHLERFDAVAKDAELFVDAHANDPVGYLWRSLARILLNRPSVGLADIEQAQQLQADAVWTDSLRGLTLLLLSQPQNAAAALDQALERAPNLIVALLAHAQAESQRGHPSRAVSDLTRVIELEPDNADAVAARGDYHVQSGKFAEAIADFNQAMMLAGRSSAMQWRIFATMARQRQVAPPAGPTGDAEDASPQPGDAEGESTARQDQRRFAELLRAVSSHLHDRDVGRGVGIPNRGLLAGFLRR